MQVENSTVLEGAIHIDYEVTSIPMSSNILKYLSIVSEKNCLLQEYS